MTIEQKALELVNVVEKQRRLPQSRDIDREYRMHEALCRALEAHEADKARHAAELREQAERFSEAASSALAMYQRVGEGDCLTAQALRTFILAPVDPLVEALKDLGLEKPDEWAPDIRKAMAVRGLAIVKKEAVNG